MLKKNLKLLIVTSIVILLPIVAGLILWNQLPEKLPIHWNVSGDVDGWANKPFVVLGIPFIMLALQWLCVLATLADPKRKNHTGKILNLVFWIVPVISVLLNIITYAVSMGGNLRVEIILPMVLGLFFVIIGNYLPKCKQNYTIGIKIPWTLNSEENWNRTHRVTGRLWVVCGLAQMLTGFFGGVWTFLAITIIMVLVPFVYSFILHRKGV